jgi:hypothetical protein
MSTSPVTLDNLETNTVSDSLSALYPVALAGANFAAAWTGLSLDLTGVAAVLAVAGLLVLAGAASRTAGY